MNNVKKSIGWADWTINPVKGLCPMACPYCYARRMYQRSCNDVFKDKTIRYEQSAWDGLYDAKPGDRIFVGSTIDLFHPLCSMWNDEIIKICANNSMLTFIFLTKCPQYLPKKWPDNCWVGVTATDQRTYNNAVYQLGFVDDHVKFISFEPLLSRIDMDDFMFYTHAFKAWKFRGTVNWVIVGLQTPYSPKTAPQISWVQEIVTAADKANIPVFLKRNLSSLFEVEKGKTWDVPKWADSGDFGHTMLRQELPERIN